MLLSSGLMSSGGGCYLCYVLVLPAAEGGRKGSEADREAEITLVLGPPASLVVLLSSI